MSPRLSDLLLRSQSDERLVSLARAGHERAFASIVQRYRPELLALARQLTSAGRAEDLLQQVFLSAFAALRSGAEVRHLRGWLYQITRNAATNARERTDLALDEFDLAGEPLEETVLRRAQALDAMSELARLPDRQRSALVDTALGGRAHADVALSMGISEQAVRQLVHRARAAVRSAVTGITPWPLARWLATAPSGATPQEVAIAAGTVSSTGAVMKLGALLAATGALATGVAVGPVGHVQRGGVDRSPATHSRRAPTDTIARTARLGSVAAASTLRVRRRARESGFSRRDARLGESAAPPATSRGSRLTAVSTASAGLAGVEDETAQRARGVSPARPQDAGTSENHRGSAPASSEASESGERDGRGSSRQDGSGSQGSGPGTAITPNSTASGSDGDAPSGHGDNASATEAGDGTEPVDSSVSVSVTSATSGQSDGASSGSDGGGGGHSGLASDASSSDDSRGGT